MSLIVMPLVLFGLTVVLQALFAGYETGFVSSNPIRVRHLAEENEDRRAARLLRYIESPDQMITMLLIGTNLMVVIGTLEISSVVESLFPSEYAGFVENAVSTLIVAPTILIFAEIIPKSVFRTHPTRLSLALLPVIEVFYLAFSPLAAPISWLSGRLMRLFGGEQGHLSALLSSLEDVRILVDEGVDHGTIEREEQEMIHSVIDLQSTTAKEIMVPRIAIQALPDTATRDDLETLFVQSGRTRLPIYNESVDNIVGVVNAYSLLTDPAPEKQSITRFCREIMHVPDSIKVRDLFRVMKASKQHMAIVMDEYGGVDGLVTMEDILEEIFGEIQDEHDHEESRIHKLGPHAFGIDARVPLEEVSEILGMPIEDEEVETVGGWLMHLAGRIPAQGEVIEHRRFRITVLAGGPNHIGRIRLDVLPEHTGKSENHP